MGVDKPEISRLDESRQEKLNSIYNKKDEYHDYSHVAIGKGKYSFGRIFEENCDLFYNLAARTDDVWICTYPRSGTNWMAETTWLLMNDLDFETAKSKPLMERVPFLEYPLLNSKLAEGKCSDETKKVFDKVLFLPERLEALPPGRLMKTHMPLELLPTVQEKQSKIIYVARNPKDVAVSFYHFHKNLLSSFKKDVDFETFYDVFQNAMGPYWNHVKEAWNLRNESNVLFLFYEEMIEDLPSVMKKLSLFLGKSYSDEQLEKLQDHLSFENFQKNKMINYVFEQGKDMGIYKPTAGQGKFVRKGKKQGWDELFTLELNKKANKWIEENYKHTDLRFPFIDIFA